MANYIFPVLDNYRISSDFGHRSSPGGIGSTNHQGIDIATGRAGSNVVAPIDGTVIFAGRAGGYGNQVQVKGSDGLTHSFSHLQGFNVAQGSNIRAGQTLGQIGSTGNSTGPHLHYGVKDGGKFIDPGKLLKGAANKLATTAKDLIGGSIGNVIGDVADVLDPSGITGNVLDAIGIGGDDCGAVCQLKKWISESGFFQRLALALVAFIVLMAAFYMMKGSQVLTKVGKAVK